MAIIEIKVPSPGESISQVELYKWLVADGEVAKKDTELAEIEKAIMDVALSYDHRVIDGRESVSFLVRVKQLLETPTDMLFGQSSGKEVLLEI